MILEGTFDTVESSILDWGDIIGPEIQKKERAEVLKDELEKSQEKIDLSPIDRGNIERLTTELNKINSELPLALKSDNTNIGLELQKQDFYFGFVENAVNANKCINLHICLYENVSKENFENAVMTQSFYCLINEDICFIFNGNDNLIGRLVNPISGSEVDIKFYLRELQTLLYWLKLHDSERQGNYLQPVFKLENLRYISAVENSQIVIAQLPYSSEFSYTPRG